MSVEAVIRETIYLKKLFSVVCDYTNVHHLFVSFWAQNDENSG